MIRTVLGDISPDEVGHAQCHEHIWLSKGASYRQNPALCMEDWTSSLRELEEYRQAGGQLIVDAQPVGCGRNAKQLAALSASSGVQIVGVTGFHKRMFFDWQDLLKWPEERLAQLYIDELTKGMLGPDGKRTDSRAGLVKTAFEGDGPAQRLYGKLFTAAAAAAVETGCCIMVHTEPGNDVLGLLDWFARQGVPAQRVMICHLDRTNYDVGYHLAVADSGCYLCYDSIHRFRYVTEHEELALILRLCEAGYGNQLLLSLDTTNQRLRAYGAADMGLDYILRNFIPLLKARGLGAQEVRKLCIENARALLELKPIGR